MAEYKDTKMVENEETKMVENEETTMAENGNCSDQVEGQIVAQSLCKPCENKDITMAADIYCDTCAEFQCKECSKVHEMYSFMKGHKLEEVNQPILPISAIPSVDMKGLDMCVEHNKQFQFYCVDHDKLLCSSCIVSKHRKCEHIEELDSEGMKASAQILPNKDLIAMASNLDDTAKSMLLDLQEAKQSIGQNVDGITNMIDEKRDLIIQQFEELKVNVTTKINEKEEETEERFDEMIARSTATIDKVTTILSDILPEVLDHGTPSQKLILQQELSKQAADCHTFKETNPVEPCTFNIEFSPYITRLLEPNHQLATLKSNLEVDEETNCIAQPDENNFELTATETRDLHTSVTETKLEETATKTNNQETNNLPLHGETKPKLPATKSKDNTDLPSTVTKTRLKTKSIQTDNTSELLQSDSAAKVPTQSSGRMTLKLLHGIDLNKVPDDSDAPLYTGMDFLPDGRLVVVDNKNKKLMVYNDCLVKLGTYTKLRGHRHSVAVISEDQVAVTAGSQIEFFHVSKANKFRFVRLVNTSSSAESFSISPMNATTVLVSNHNSTPSMRMISLLDGSEEYFNNLKRKQYSFDTNKCTYISSADMLALTDCNANTVFLYTRNGKHLNGKAVLHASIQEPRGICEGSDNSVIVCSSPKNSIVQVSTSGTILASHKLDMPLPYTVCMSRDKQKLVVSNSAAVRKLQVYHIHYCNK